jgi:RNA polymerase sigma-70 factor (ECF subfamily)
VDDALVRAACSGDRDSLSALCENLYPPLRRFFAGLAGPEGADDLTQEALMRMLDRLPGFRLLPGARFEGWVFRIAYRLFLDEKRRRAELPLPDWECADTSAGPEEAAVACEREAAVRGAVDRLPDELRAMVTMRYALDMRYRDIARALGVAELRVKWRLHDALKQLKPQLEEVRKG